MKLLSTSATAVIVVVLAAASSSQLVSGQNTYPIGGNFTNCDPIDYYSPLVTSTLTPNIIDIPRNEMRQLIMNTHMNVLPYTSDEPDVWDALIAVDGYDDTVTGNRLIKRIYSSPDMVVPAVPYDQGSCQYWNREHMYVFYVLILCVSVVVGGCFDAQEETLPLVLQSSILIFQHLSLSLTHVANNAITLSILPHTPRTRWPKSLGVGDGGADYTDIHHLRPEDCKANAARGNLLFGACGTGTSISSCNTPGHANAANDTTRDSVSFLPPSHRRGDIARAMFYMELRYDGDEPGTTDLILSDCALNVPNK